MCLSPKIQDPLVTGKSNKAKQIIFEKNSNGSLSPTCSISGVSSKKFGKTSDGSLSPTCYARGASFSIFGEDSDGSLSPI